MSASGVCVTRSLALWVCFMDRCLSLCRFCFGHCIVCPSSIYEFWLPLWYLQTLLIRLVLYQHTTEVLLYFKPVYNMVLIIIAMLICFKNKKK